MLVANWTMKQILIILILFSSFKLNAQENVQWSDLEARKGYVVSILPEDSNIFYTLRWSGGQVFGQYIISKHEDFKIVASMRIKLQVDQRIANFEGLKSIGGRLYVFLSDRFNGKNNLYIVGIAEDLATTGKPKLIASYDLDKSHKYGDFQVLQSSNEEYFGIVWELPGRGDNRTMYGFKVFDKNLEEINIGEYPLPFDKDLIVINAHHIANNGDYFLALTEFDDDEKKSYMRNRLRYKELHIYHISEDGLTDFVLDVKGQRVDAMAMTSDSSGIFTITGLYGQMEKRGVQGVFYQRVDMSTAAMISEGFKEFPNEFITQDWSEKDWKKQKKKEERGIIDEPQLFNYDMREAVILEDGSVVGTMEQYYVQVRSYSDMQSGQSSNTYYYYYNDIIVYRIDPAGNFEWIEKIPKFQVSTNDSGFYSSYESFTDNGKINFIFNDDLRNYDSSGMYAMKGSDVYAASYGRKNNTVAMVSMDVSTGEQIRRTFFDREEISALAVPKLFNVDDKHRQMLIYALWGRKEKFGIIMFDNPSLSE